MNTNQPAAPKFALTKIGTGQYVTADSQNLIHRSDQGWTVRDHTGLVSHHATMNLATLALIARLEVLAACA